MNDFLEVKDDDLAIDFLIFSYFGISVYTDQTEHTARRFSA